MARGKSEGPLPPPNLTVPKEEAFQKIRSLIEEGKSILEEEIRSKEDFGQVDSSASKWSSFCHELLSRYFDNQKYAEEFNHAGLTSVAFVSRGGPPPISEKIDRIRKRMRAKIQELESISERLELISGPMVAIPKYEIQQEPKLK